MNKDFLILAGRRTGLKALTKHLSDLIKAAKKKLDLMGRIMLPL
jgi:hypothetical protein